MHLNLPVNVSRYGIQSPQRVKTNMYLFAQPTTQQVQFEGISNDHAKFLALSKMTDDEFLALLVQTTGSSDSAPVAQHVSGVKFSLRDLVGRVWISETPQVMGLNARMQNTWDLDFVDAVEAFLCEQPTNFDHTSIFLKAIVEARHRIKGEQQREKYFGPL